MNEYRCTRNVLYNHDCLGQFDLTARQGHYVEAENPEDALAIMAYRYPGETFTCDLHKKNIDQFTEDDQGSYIVITDNRVNSPTDD